MHNATDANQSPNYDDVEEMSSSKSVENGALDEPAWSADVLKQWVFEEFSLNMFITDRQGKLSKLQKQNWIAD